MKISLRKILLVVWFISLISAGILVYKTTNSAELGFATSFGIVGVSLGVPLMRAFTEFSK